MGKVIHGELCKKLKLYMHKPESTLEKETHKILSDFEIKTDHLISARQPDLEIANKRIEPAE